MNTEDILQRAGVKPSPVRMLLLKCLQEATGPLSAQELEQRLETVDRSSISRTLAIFSSRHLVHTIDDGSGSCKFEICHAPECHSAQREDHNAGQTEYGDLHPHFYCENCHKTFCIDSVPLPHCPLPEGFRAHSANFVIKGLCPECSRLIY